MGTVSDDEGGGSSEEGMSDQGENQAAERGGKQSDKHRKKARDRNKHTEAQQHGSVGDTYNKSREENARAASDD